MNSDEILLIQKFYNRLGKKKIKEDGRLGPQTRDAVRYLQNKAHLPPDGYPDYLLLSKIKNYDAKTGFNAPLPARKSKRK